MKQQEQNEQEFAFIKEKIKDKPINKRRLLIRAGYNILCAVIFGVVACVVFVWLRPYLEEWLYPKEESTISIPKDDGSPGRGGNRGRRGRRGRGFRPVCRRARLWWCRKNWK